MHEILPVMYKLGFENNADRAISFVRLMGRLAAGAYTLYQDCEGKDRPEALVGPESGLKQKKNRGAQEPDSSSASAFLANSTALFTLSRCPARISSFRFLVVSANT